MFIYITQATENQVRKETIDKSTDFPIKCLQAIPI